MLPNAGMTIGTVALALVAAQLALTVLFQFAPFKTRLVRLDYVGALPRWLFFVPRHGTHDYAIAVRERHADGMIGDWRTLWEMPVRTRWTWLWSPDRDDDASLWFAAALLDRRVEDGREAGPDSSHGYALILDRCRRRLAGDVAEFRFALVRIGKTEEIGFTSPFHARVP